jgi:hypothetical protein
MNNPITRHDYKNALTSYGEDVGVLKGKTTRKITEHVKKDTGIHVETHRIILSVDFMYSLGVTFLVTVSHDVRFITVTVLEDQRKQMIPTALQQVMKVYKGRGHIVEIIEFNAQSNPLHMILADDEFHILQEDLENESVQVTIVSKDEHVPEEEWQNRVLKV